MKKSTFSISPIYLIFPLVAFIFLVGCRQPEHDAEEEVPIGSTERIKMDGLEEELTEVFTGKDEFEFIGITSNGVDCLYFPYKDGKFNIDFEMLSGEQRAYLPKIKEFAQSKGLPYTMTTYRSKDYYKVDLAKNVIRIEANTDLKSIAQLAAAIESEVFHNNEKTVYDVIPQ